MKSIRYLLNAIYGRLFILVWENVTKQLYCVEHMKGFGTEKWLVWSETHVNSFRKDSDIHLNVYPINYTWKKRSLITMPPEAVQNISKWTWPIIFLTLALQHLNILYGLLHIAGNVCEAEIFVIFNQIPARENVFSRKFFPPKIFHLRVEDIAQIQYLDRKLTHFVTETLNKLQKNFRDLHQLAELSKLMHCVWDTRISHKTHTHMNCSRKVCSEVGVDNVCTYTWLWNLLVTTCS